MFGVQAIGQGIFAAKAFLEGEVAYVGACDAGWLKSIERVACADEVKFVHFENYISPSESPAKDVALSP